MTEREKRVAIADIPTSALPSACPEMPGPVRRPDRHAPPAVLSPLASGPPERSDDHGSDERVAPDAPSLPRTRLPLADGNAAAKAGAANLVPRWPHPRAPPDPPRWGRQSQTPSADQAASTTRDGKWGGARRTHRRTSSTEPGTRRRRAARLPRPDFETTIEDASRSPRPSAAPGLRPVEKRQPLPFPPPLS